MIVRKDLLGIIGLSLTCVLALLYTSSRLILLNSFARLEERNVQEEVQHALGELIEDQENLDTIAVSYANWDAAYAFVSGEQNNFPQENFTDEDFEFLHLNLVLIVNPTGEIVFGSGYDLVTGKPTPIPASLLTHITPSDRLLDHRTTDSSQAGIVLLPEGPMMVASRPILTSDSKGPVRGTLIVGHYLSASGFDQLAPLAGQSITFFSFDAPQLPADFAVARANLSQASPTLVQPLDAVTVAGYSLIMDLYSRPALLLRVNVARDVYAQGQASLNYFIAWFVILGLVSGVVLYIALDRLLLSRQAYQTSETKYQSIFENAVEGIFQSAPAGRFINVNPAMARIYGYNSPQEMVKSITSISSQIYVDSDERDKFIRLLQTQSVVDNFEGCNHRKDGAIIWTSTSARAVRDAAGNILYYEGFLQDITGRKQVEEALKNNEKRFRALIENGLDNISLLAADGTLLWESPAVNRALGYTPDEFVGHDVFELMHPDDLDWTRNLLAKLIQSPADPQRGSFRLRRSDGTWRWVEAVATNLLNEPSINAIVLNYRDITERKQAEDALRESEEHYRLLFENNPLPMWAYDLETLRFLTVNDAAVEHYGYDKDEFLAMTIKDIRSLEELPRLEANLMEPRQRQERSGPWKHRKKDGTRIDVEIISHNLTFLDRPARLVLANDITERKQAEEALRLSEERFRSLIEQSSEGIILLDEQGIIIEWNRAEERITGIPHTRALGSPFWDIQYQILIPERRAVRNPESLRKTFFESFQTGQSPQLGKPVEVEIESVTGERKSILQTAFLVRSHKGNRLGAIVRDITERKRTEQALRESEERNRAIVNAVPDLLFQISRDGLILDYRAPDESALYAAPEVFLGKNLKDVLPPHVAQSAGEAIEESLRFNKMTMIEYELPIHGERRFYEDRIVPLSKDRALSVIRDITERKYAEEKIRLTLEEKETLLREVHHRVKNNLQAIIALIDMQARQIPEAGTRQFLKELEGQARTMSLVYEQLYQSENLARVDMASYLQQLTSNILETFNRGLAIQLNVDASLSLDVAQAMPCGLIVNELFSNILKHAFPPDFTGQPAVHIALRQDGEMYHLTVSDNGVGLSSGYDWHSSRTLGLRLVNLWATHQLGGTLDVTGEPGTCFSVTFGL